jgi:hypothetical protein
MISILLRTEGMPPVDPMVDRRSWGILGGRRSVKEPVDRAASVEIAHDAIPTPAWTAPRTRRPQRPTGPLAFTNEDQRHKMTRHSPQRRLTTRMVTVASLR